MKRLLLPLLTCSLLAACGAGTASVPTDSGSGSGGMGTGGASGGTAPSTCAASLSSSSLGVQSPGAQSLGIQSLGIRPLSVTDAGRPDWSAPHVAREVLIVGGPVAAVQSLGLQAAIDNLGLIRASTPAGQTDQGYAETLRAQGLQVQPNYLYKSLDVPNDPGYPGDARAGVMIEGKPYDQDYLTRINAEEGWKQLGAAPQGAKVAVLDTGVDVSHPDLQGRLLPGCNFGDGNNDVSEVTSGDGVGHGTSSIGLIGAATNNGIGIAGLTWTGQNILPVKVFTNDGATTLALAQGIRYAAAQGAKVINMSLGFVGSSDPTVAAAIQAAAARDVLMVAAAGNTATDGLYYPASDNSVMAVGAIGGTDPKAANYNDLACYSARPKAGQKALDLVAPGGNAGTGTDNCYQNSGYDILTLATVAQGGYTLRAGTSEAAPQVSGAAALIRAYRPNLTADQVRAILTSTATTVSGGRLLNVGAAVAQAGKQ